MNTFGIEALYELQRPFFICHVFSVYVYPLAIIYSVSMSL